jgi:hypothetical protein
MALGAVDVVTYGAKPSTEFTQPFFNRATVQAARNTNLHWNAVMEGVIRISHLIELVYSQKIPKKLVKKILWYYLVTIPNYV